MMDMMPVTVTRWPCAATDPSAQPSHHGHVRRGRPSHAGGLRRKGCSSTCGRLTGTARSTSRRSALAGLFGLGAASLPVAPLPALALITGSKPPEGGFKAKERKCKSIDECEALGAKTEQEKYADVDTSFERTAGGDRYRDLSTGSGRAAAKGDAVEIRYRVMRLGTRARDGLSGEGQTIFSFGFGEDEDKEGEKVCRVLGPRTCGPAGRVAPIPSRTRLRAPCWRS